MVRLRPYHLEDEAAALAAHEALRADRFPFLLKEPDRSWPDFVRDQLDQREGRELPDGWPPGTQLAAIDDGVLVGRVRLRFTLSNAFLEEHAGHVGYAVVPAWRGRGYATAILAQALVILRSHGVERVLVTCGLDNVASRRVIEKVGGRFERLTGVEEGEGPHRRYWFD